MNNLYSGGFRFPWLCDSGSDEGFAIPMTTTAAAQQLATAMATRNSSDWNLLSLSLSLVVPVMVWVRVCEGVWVFFCGGGGGGVVVGGGLGLRKEVGNLELGLGSIWAWIWVWVFRFELIAT